MKIKVVTLYDNNRKSAGDISSQTSREYCRLHGYQFACYRHLPDPKRTAFWNKIRAVQQELDGCDWLLWHDADAMVVNLGFELEYLIATNPDKNLLFSSDRSGLCCGVFLVRNCAWSVRYFEAAWFLGQMKRETGLKYFSQPGEDQETLMAMNENFQEVSSKVGLIGQDVIQNPECEFSPLAFMMHWWTRDTARLGITHRMKNAVQEWSPKAHKDILIVTKHSEHYSFQVKENLKCEYQTMFSDRLNTPSRIKQAIHEENRFTVWMSPTAFAIRRFDEVQSEDHDVGFTMRRLSERNTGRNPIQDGFLHADVVFANATAETMRFMDLWLDMMKRVKSGSATEALNILVLQATDLTQCGEVFMLDDIRIKIFDCEHYNFFYYPEQPDDLCRIVNANIEPERIMKQLAL